MQRNEFRVWMSDYIIEKTIYVIIYPYRNLSEVLSAIS